MQKCMVNKKNGTHKNENAIIIFLKLSRELIIKSPLLFVLEVVCSFIHSFLIIANVITLQMFLDCVSNNKQSNNTIIFLFVILIIEILFKDFFNAIDNILPNINNAMLRKILQKKIQNKSEKLDVLLYEYKEKVETIEKAEYGRRSLVGIYAGERELLTFYLPYIVFAELYFIKMNILLSIIVPIIFIPVVVNQIIRDHYMEDAENKVAPYRIKKEKFTNILINKKSLKEIRFLGSFGFIFNKLRETAWEMYNIKYAVNKKCAFMELISNCITAIGYGACTILLVFFTVRNYISIGTCIAIFLSLNEMYSILDELLTRCIKELSSSMGEARNFFSFLKLPERPMYIAGASAYHTDIIFQNVSFKYPNSKNKALKNINFKIKGNKTIAIVGENGSGKSTLMKLLSGMYLPSQGIIKINGRDTKKIGKNQLFDLASGVPQNCSQYKMTLRDNLLLGTKKLLTDHEIEKICENYGFPIKKEIFPDGLDTILGREFGGIDVSGGQWQFITIIRGVLKESDILFLDEPTSAIDAVKEDEIFTLFYRKINSKKVFIVTHRISAAQIADCIFVMKNGALVEIGTHDELISLKSEYYRLWKAQGVFYK